MSAPPNAARARYHALRVKRVVAETADAKSIVFDVPPTLAGAFAYAAGQFVTLRVVIDGQPHRRSYSMSSAPSLDPDLQVTVKRVPDGLVSNWLNDAVSEGDVLEVSVPAGAFVLTDVADDVVAFAAGSGITPILSITKAALHTTHRRVRLLCANRDRGSAIFADLLDELAARYAERLTVEHHEDVVSGFIGHDEVSAFAAESEHGSFYLCGPTGFMEVVERALVAERVVPEQIHIERFTPADEAPEPPEPEVPENGPEPATVTITIGSRTETVTHRGRSTILQSARWGGLRPPSSCEAGHCATCMAKLVEGDVAMATNDVLTDDELAEGWVLTCQAVPVSTVVRVVYDP